MARHGRQQISAGVDGGLSGGPPSVLSPGSAQAGPSAQPPIDTSGNVVLLPRAIFFWNFLHFHSAMQYPKNPSIRHLY